MAAAIQAVGIALGSNLSSHLGSSQELIVYATNLLAQLSLTPIKKASIHRTEPVDCPPGSPDFLNTVVEISYAGSPQELLQATQSIESQLGRKNKQVTNEPRPIDIDILYMGNTVIQGDDNLSPILPHPRMLQRNFVLEPLSEIAATLILPHTELTVEQHLDLLKNHA